MIQIQKVYQSTGNLLNTSPSDEIDALSIDVVSEFPVEKINRKDLAKTIVTSICEAAYSKCL